MKRLEGKNAIISGAASGVGRAASLLFARKGTAVACVDIDARTGAESADMVRDEGGSAVFVEDGAARGESPRRKFLAARRFKPQFGAIWQGRPMGWLGSPGGCVGDVSG